MKTYIYKNINNQKGVTLVELLVAMAVFSIVVAGIVASRNTQQNQSMTQQQAVNVQQNVRAALSMIVSEIRMAGYNPYGGDLGQGIISAGVGTAAAPFTFAYIADDDEIDNDDDGSIDEKKELKTISYLLNGTDLMLNDGGTDKLIAENISSLIFTYLDENNAVTATLNDIRAVTISITAATPTNELDRTVGKNNTRSLTTTVKCRNLGL
ncbi:MAG: PilW family protein [Desulfamplus sp.]